jgi:Bifunctional DNA primase/polymerase, N-terminal
MGAFAHSGSARDTATADRERQADAMNAGALDLTRLPRFPCRSDNKKPMTAHGFKDAVRVRDDSGFPLVGVPTGVKFDVLDVDPRNGGTAWFDANFDALPLTRCHQTSGGGIHLLFRPSAGLRCTSGRIAPGVDVKAKGGYVIWWPREGLPFEDHPLCEWPDWLLAEAMRPKSAVKWNPITPPPPHARDHADNLTAALAKLDPRKWNGQFGEWFVLMAACRFVGIERDAWIEWCVRDPDYAGDGEVIARQWEGLAPKHGGAFWTALSEAGIKLTQARNAGAGKSNGVPSYCIPTRNLRGRLYSIQRAVEQAQGADREPALFRGACTCAEIIAERRWKLTPSTAKALLLSAASVNGLLREIGKDEVQRTIANGLRWIEEKLLAQPEKGT